MRERSNGLETEVYYINNKDGGCEMKTYERKCRFCGVMFITDNAKKRCCSYECSYRYANSLTKSVGTYEHKHINTEKHLTNMCIEARKQGLSYGQLMARKYMAKG